MIPKQINAGLGTWLWLGPRPTGSKAARITKRVSMSYPLLGTELGSARGPTRSEAMREHTVNGMRREHRATEVTRAAKSAL